MRNFIIICALFFHGTLLYAATEFHPRSRVLSLKPLQESERLQLPILDKEQLLMTSKMPESFTSKGKILRPLQIAQPTIINQSIKQMGQWQTINNETIWRLDISGKEALHLNIGFKNVFFPESAQLLISDKNTGKILQQYSAKDNKVHGELWTPLFDTQELQLEINIRSSDVDKLSLDLTQIAQGYIAITSSQKSTKSGACNIDVVCPQGDNWRNEIRSVARYVISGAFACTGTLINNTRGDREPLFITAAHCGVSDTTAPSMVFYWNYQNSVCGGTRDGTLQQSQTGASLISRWEGLSTSAEFALVRLDNLPDVNFGVYYSGWDNQDQSHTGARSIHHPSGHEKSISIDNNDLTITDYSSETMNNNSRYLMVSNWDEGTTEGGSSGSGLWNLSHHLVGTLSGGAASCDEPAASDWYGRIAKQWLGNNFKSNQLAAYLAPNLSNALTLDGIDSCSAPILSISISNNTPAVGEQISFTSSVFGGSGGYSYQWDFDHDGTVDSTVANPIHTYSTASNNKVSLTVRDSVQCPAIARAVVLAADNNEAFLRDGLLPSGFEKTASVEGSWIVDDSRSTEGLFSLKSQIINENQASSIELTDDYEAGTISFSYRISSEANYDYFKFYIDNVEKINLSGERGWTAASFPITAGNHQFRWVFEKDGGLSIGQDASWIDNLQLPNINTNTPPTVATSIANQTNTEGDVINLDVSASFEDADGDTLSFSIADGPASLTIDRVTGIISGTLTTADATSSPYTISVTASDGFASIASTFSWRMDALPVSPPPVTPPSSSGGGGSSGFAILGLLFLTLSFRRKG